MRATARFERLRRAAQGVELAALAELGRVGIGPFALPGSRLWPRLWWSVWIVVLLRVLASAASRQA